MDKDRYYGYGTFSACMVFSFLKCETRFHATHETELLRNDSVKFSRVKKNTAAARYTLINVFP